MQPARAEHGSCRDRIVLIDILRMAIKGMYRSSGKSYVAYIEYVQATLPSPYQARGCVCPIRDLELAASGTYRIIKKLFNYTFAVEKPSETAGKPSLEDKQTNLDPPTTSSPRLRPHEPTGSWKTQRCPVINRQQAPIRTRSSQRRGCRCARVVRA